MFIVSECLAGVPCRMDGRTKLIPGIKALVDAGEAVTVCPEVLGGLPTPRSPSEIQPDGRVVNKLGEDVTAAFVGGAERAMAICREHGCTGAILKARSPSCGKGVIYDGSFTGTRVAGNGVFAQMLLNAGIPVMTEEEGTLLCEAVSEHAFLDKAGKPVRVNKQYPELYGILTDTTEKEK